MKTNFAFDFCADIESALDFDQIPVSELCNAIRQRLARVEATNDHGAFGMIDSFQVEEDGIEF